VLAKIAPSTNDFNTLARYLVRGKPGTVPDPKRVSWIATQNLPTDDPELAATYMAATAAASQRVRRAAYHLMVAWHANEHPTLDKMREIAFETLTLAGLAEHEALIMGHGDKPHPHLHILLNRVHPATGKAWSTGHDYKLFDAIMRQLSDAHGFRYVPAHTFNDELTDELPRRPNSRATYAGMRGAKTRRLQWSRASSRRFGTDVSEELGKSPSPEELAEIVAKRGLRLERKGQGYVVGNDVSYAKLSRLKLSSPGKHTARERTPSVYGRRDSLPMVLVDAIDIVRALKTIGLADRDDLERAIAERDQTRTARRQQLPLIHQANLAPQNGPRSTYLNPIGNTGSNNGKRSRLSDSPAAPIQAVLPRSR
jgi:hypothetical protein